MNLANGFRFELSGKNYTVTEVYYDFLFNQAVFDVIADDGEEMAFTDTGLRGAYADGSLKIETQQEQR